LDLRSLCSLGLSYIHSTAALTSLKRLSSFLVKCPSGPRSFLPSWLRLVYTLSSSNIFRYSCIDSIAPRFISKFVTTAYAPLDKEIIREAWVCGDLKDRLGIGHRNPKKNSLAHEATDKLEYVPILNPPHARSGSSASLINQQELQSDGDTNVRTLPRSTSPDVVQPESINSGPLGSASPRQHLQPNDTQRSSGSTPDRQLSPSPNPSYYSASEIPIPSPLPPPVYRLTSGEITNMPPPGRSMSLRRTSNSIDLDGSPTNRLTTQEPLQGTRPSKDGGAYEMQIRRSPPMSTSTRMGSDASYATAQDDWLVVDHEERTVVPDDDSATVTGERHSHRESSDSWAGGRAL
jgi:phospholipid-translocating ATPase